MGGYGSGRKWHYGSKATTGAYRSIDVRRWNRDNLLVPGDAFRWQWSREGEVVASIDVKAEPGRVILTYRHRSGGGEWKDESYPVHLTTTPCHMGGERHWFLCPAQGCGQRVAKLYCGVIFACRKCHQLAYDSQRENDADRARRQADRIRSRLGWPRGLWEGSNWGRPKGMHWRTYERLRAEHDALEEVVNRDFIARAIALFPSLGKGLKSE
jgi:hypothetical protein